MSIDDWEIDKSTGRDILIYKKCSVIEDEQAHYIMSLINRDQTNEKTTDNIDERNKPGP